MSRVENFMIFILCSFSFQKNICLAVNDFKFEMCDRNLYYRNIINEEKKEMRKNLKMWKL